MGKWTTLFQPVLFMGQQYSPYDHFPDTALLTVFNVVTCVPPGDLEGGTTSATGLRVSSAGRAPYRLGVRVCVLVWVSTQSCSALQDLCGQPWLFKKCLVHGNLHTLPVPSSSGWREPGTEQSADSTVERRSFWYYFQRFYTESTYGRSKILALRRQLGSLPYEGDLRQPRSGFAWNCISAWLFQPRQAHAVGVDPDSPRG